jgi:hypothetical protein
MNRGVDRREIGRGSLLQLVDEHQRTQAKIARGLAKHLEEGGRIISESALVRYAVDRLDVDSQGHHADGRIHV